jgi:hypothetical protein
MNNLSMLKKKMEYRRYSKLQENYNIEQSFSSVAQLFKNRNSLYAYFHHYYHHRCPKIVQDHCEYFKKEQRGFGEEAFHAMWWLLLLEYKPKQILEIGVYRGQVISLCSMISKYLHRPCEVHGISPFSSLGDSVSNYLNNLDYMADVLEHFAYWELPNPVMVKALSTDPEAVSYIKSKRWGMIYIDGSHDFEVAIKDYKLCFENLNVGGILILDDASLNTDYRPPSFSFAGHPGPSKVAREFADIEMDFIGAVGHNNVYRKK